MSKSYGQKESGSKSKLYWTIGIIIAVLVAILLIWNSGIFTKNATAATVGDQEYTVAEVAYYYQAVANQTIQNAKQYKQFGMDMGYDPDKSPADQFYNEEEKKTYADYFLETALKELQRVSILCSQAEAESYSLSADGQKAVEDNFSALKTYSLQAGATESSYLKMLYGRYMTKALFEDMITQSVLADEYAKAKADTFTYSDEDLQTYYAENAASLDSYDYRFCYINYETEEKTDAEGNPVDPTDEEIKAAMAEASQKADSMIREVQSGTEFNTAAQNYLDETSADSYSDPEYNHKTDTLGSALTSTFKDWMMEDGRYSGEITSIEMPNTGYCVVQFLGRDKGENIYQTMNYRNILVLSETTENEAGTASLPTDEQLTAAKEKADALLQQWKDGEATADSFAALAKENSADEVTKENGGLNEEANRDSLSASLVDWLFAPGRQIGEAAVVDYTDDAGNVVGYELVFVQDFGEIRWKYQAGSSLRAADYDEWFSGIEGEYPAALTDSAKKIPSL